MVCKWFDILTIWLYDCMQRGVPQNIIVLLCYMHAADKYNQVIDTTYIIPDQVL